MRILKKAAALIMVCIMLMSMMPFAAFADHDHNWVYDDKDNHKCNADDCTVAGGATEAHEWEKQTNGSYKCSACNATCAHNSTKTWTDGVCNYCGQPCNHAWKDKKDAGHTQVCSNCGMTCTHTGTWDAETGKCTVCGYECTHDYDTSTGICKICGYKCKHTAGWNDSADMKICKTCGFICGDSVHKHDWANTDAVCTVCGATHDHNFNSSTGICSVCEYECTHDKHDINGACTACGKTGQAHKWDENGKCEICEYQCLHENIVNYADYTHASKHKCKDCGALLDHNFTGSVDHICIVCGYPHTVKNHNFNKYNLCTICGLKAIAKVNGIAYASMNEVIEAYNNATDPVLTFIQDYSGDDTITLKNPSGTIDLNGCTLKSKVKVVGDVTLKNSSTKTTGTFGKPDKNVETEDPLLEVEGTLTLPTPASGEKEVSFDCSLMTAIKASNLVVGKDNATKIENSYVGIYVTNGGTVNIDAESAISVSGQKYSVLYEGGSETDPEGDAIKGGTYTGTVSTNGKKTRFISGGSFSSVPNAYCITGYGAPTDVKPYVVTKLTEVNGKYVNIKIELGSQRTKGSAPFDLTKAKVNFDIEKLKESKNIDLVKLGEHLKGLTLKDYATVTITVSPIIEVKSFTEPNSDGLITVTYDIRLSATVKCGSTITVDPIECFKWDAVDMQVVLPYGIFGNDLTVTHNWTDKTVSPAEEKSEEYVPGGTGTQKNLDKDDATQTASFYVEHFSDFILSGKGSVVCELTNGKANPTSSDIRGYYENIEDAVAASTSASDVVVMLADFSTDSDLDGEAKINLNGYDIGALTIENGSITVYDTKQEPADWGHITDAGGGIGVQVNTGASFKLESGTVNGGIKNYGSTTVSGGEVYGPTAIDNASADSVLVITGGTVEGTSYMAIDTYAGSVTTVSGDAKIASSNAEAICSLGTLNISGGEITGKEAIELNSGSTTITGGILTGSESNTIYCPASASFDELSISGGQFASKGTEIGANIRVDDTKVESNINVSGGVFSAEVKDTHCADDYVPGSNENPATKTAYPYTVKAKEYAATVTDADGNTVGGNQGRYETLKEAIAAVPTGGKVTINKDLTEDAVINRSGISFTLDGSNHTCGDITVEAVSDVYIYGLSDAGDVTAYSGNVHIMSGKYGTHTLQGTKAKFVISGYPIDAPTDFPYFMDQVYESECYQGWKDADDQLKYQTEDSYLRYVPAKSSIANRPYTVALFNPSITSTDPANRYIYYKSSTTFSPNTVTITTDDVPGDLLKNDKGAYRCLKINDYYYDEYGNKYTYNSSTDKWTTSGTSTTPCYGVGTNDDGNAYIYVYAAGITKFFNSTGNKNVQVGFVTGATNVAAFTVGSSVRTGDVNNVMVWIGVAVGAVVVFGGAAYIILKKNKRSAQ